MNSFQQCGPQVVPDRAAAEDEFDCTVDLPASMFPALVFGHGATHAGFQRQGLNALLRYYFFQALQPGDGKVRASLTLVYSGASRVELLKTLGYEFSGPAKVWDPEAHERAPALLAVLPRNRLTAAQDRLAAMSATSKRISIPMRSAIDRLQGILGPADST
jgi:hypothetical protein